MTTKFDHLIQRMVLNNQSSDIQNTTPSNNNVAIQSKIPDDYPIQQALVHRVKQSGGRLKTSRNKTKLKTEEQNSIHDSLTFRRVVVDRVIIATLLNNNVLETFEEDLEEMENIDVFMERKTKQIGSLDMYFKKKMIWMQQKLASQRVRMYEENNAFTTAGIVHLGEVLESVRSSRNYSKEQQLIENEMMDDVHSDYPENIVTVTNLQIAESKNIMRDYERLYT